MGSHEYWMLWGVVSMWLGRSVENGSGMCLDSILLELFHVKHGSFLLGCRLCW